MTRLHPQHRLYILSIPCDDLVGDMKDNDGLGDPRTNVGIDLTVDLLLASGRPVDQLTYLLATWLRHLLTVLFFVCWANGPAS